MKSFLKSELKSCENLEILLKILVIWNIIQDFCKFRSPQLASIYLYLGIMLPEYKTLPNYKLIIVNGIM